MTFNFRSLAIVLLFGSSLMAAACNNDNDSPTSSSPPTPVATPTPTPTPEATPTPEPSPAPGAGEVSFVGVVKDVQGNNLFIGGQSVTVTPQTSFILEDGTPWSLAAVQPGQHVRVRGIPSDGFITAKRITLLT